MKYISAIVIAATLSACSTVTTENNNGVGQGGSNTLQTNESVAHLNEKRLPHLIYFQNDSVEISGNAQLIVKSHADHISANRDISVSLQGSASTPGDDEYNYALGLKRAKKVAEALVGYGVSRDQISTSSIGDTGSTMGELGAEQSKRRVTISY